MAVDHLVFSPTTDIHLIKGGAGITVTIVSNSYDPPNAQDVTATVLGTLAFSTPNIAQVNGTTITPVAVGETLGVMSYVDSGNTHYLLLRVKVHNSIQSIWFGNNKVTLTTGDTCLLSVYAKFDDNSFGDVTAHPYLNFSSGAPAFVSVDASGKVTALHSGSSLIDVTGPGTDHVTVVVNDLVTPNPILERIWGSGPVAQGRNLLILAEGFSSTDKAYFDQWKLEVQKRIFQSKSHRPYDLLRDSWNVWAAFEPSSESGIGVGYPVTAPDSNNYSKPFDITNPDPNGPRILQAKNSRYGLIYGGRPGERRSMILGQVPLATEWNNPLKPWRLMGEDLRRTEVLSNAYLDTLKNKNAASGSSEYDVGQRWKYQISSIAASPNGAVQAGNVVTITTNSAHGFSAGMQVQIDEVDNSGYNGLQTVQSVPSATTFTYNLVATGLAASGGGSIGGPDRGLVAFLVYDTYDGGGQFGDAFAASLGRLLSFHAVPDPTTSALDHKPQQGDAVIDAVGATFAHEMSHALGLGDEYDGYDGGTRSSLSNNPIEDKQIEENGNLTVLDTIIGAAGGSSINTAAIKWNWDRMAQSSRLAQDLAAPGGATFDVVLDAGQGVRWSPAQTNATDVYLRRRIVDQPVPNPILLREGPLKVTNISGDTVTLQGAVGTSGFRQGSVLYIPKTANGQILTLIPAQVLTFLGTSGAFPRPLTCDKSYMGSEDPPSIPNFHYPRHHNDLVGLYTGGGRWNCNVFRPCGNCKMREAWKWEQAWSWWPPGTNTVVELFDFCFVCKYYIVDLINAGKHEMLDKQYPEDC